MRRKVREATKRVKSSLRQRTMGKARFNISIEPQTYEAFKKAAGEGNVSKVVELFMAEFAKWPNRR